MPRTKEAFKHIRDASRQHILDKAAEVFARKGLADTKVSDLAEAAGVSQGLLYRYFTDKDDLFIALLETPVNGAVQWTQSAMQYIGSPMDKLHWLTEQFLRGMSEKPEYFQILAQAMALSGRVSVTLVKLQAVVTILRKLIAEGQKMGKIVKRDPDQLVFLYIGCLFGLAAGRSINVRWIDNHFPDAEGVLQILKA